MLGFFSSAVLLIGLTAAVPVLEQDETFPQSRRALLSYSTSYCYVYPNGTLKGDGWLPDGCTDEPVHASACTVGSNSLCVLGGNQGGVDKSRWEVDYAFNYCEETLVYVRGAGQWCTDADTSCHYYCNQLTHTGIWATRRRAAITQTAESDGTSWFWCKLTGWNPWNPWDWHEGRCRHGIRFLGESCWDDRGECYNAGITPYDGLRLACATLPSAAVYTPTCIPAGYRVERNSCSCNVFDCACIHLAPIKSRAQAS